LNWKIESFHGQLFIAFFLSNCFNNKNVGDVSSLKALKSSQLRGMSHSYYQADRYQHRAFSGLIKAEGKKNRGEEHRERKREREGEQRRKTQGGRGSEQDRRENRENAKPTKELSHHRLPLFQNKENSRGSQHNHRLHLL
jgi:hypothetical protein